MVLRKKLLAIRPGRGNPRFSFLLKKLTLGFGICLVLSVLFFREFWVNIPLFFSASYLQLHGVYYWGVLLLCFLWIWLKRREIVRAMQGGKISPLYVFIGLALIGLSFVAPGSNQFIAFPLLLLWLGVFAVLFGEAALLPAILLGIYGFTLLFPEMISRFAETQYSMVTVWTVVAILAGFGFPITHQGRLIVFAGLSGDSVSILIGPTCAGHASMGVFLALFALMMLDIRLSPKKATFMFLFGVIGTWLQNILRVVIVVLVGYQWGEEVLYMTHYYVAYFIFPLWYALFAYIYLRQVGKAGVGRFLRLDTSS